MSRHVRWILAFVMALVVAAAALGGMTGPGATPARANGAPVTTVAPETALRALGVAQTFVFTLPANVTCASDPDDPDTDTDVDCTAAVVNLGVHALLSGPTVADDDIADATTVSVTIYNNAAAVSTVTLDLCGNVNDGIPGNEVCFESVAATLTVVAAELRNVSEEELPPIANGLDSAAPQGLFRTQDVWNLVRGSRHVVCTVEANTAIPSSPWSWSLSEERPLVIPLTAPLAQINASPGGGYSGSQPVGPQTPTFADVQVFLGDGVAVPAGGNGGFTGATCFSWVSTGAGDQEISVTYTSADSTTQLTVEWDTDADGNNDSSTPVGNRTLVAEWNVLEDSLVSLSGVYTGSGRGNSTTVPALRTAPRLVSTPGGYQLEREPLVVTAVFEGAHTRRDNKLTDEARLAGVPWRVWIEGCGSLTGPLTGRTYLGAEMSERGDPDVRFSPDGGALPDCMPGLTARVFFEGREPNPSGSGSGLTVTAFAEIVFPAVSTKQVLAAWAGQRIILEHDWRVPPGDGRTGTPAGVCPWQGFDSPQFDWVKGGGPGNFIPALGVDVEGNDQAHLAAGTMGDGTSQQDVAPDFPQWSCITRVMFESDQPGQVDVEHFVDQDWWDDVPALADVKMAFVVYYMKFEHVTLGLPTSGGALLSKGASHNSTAKPDWAPGNPWDTRGDLTSTDANVSRDVLVRGRVSGWFLNENPSGRPRDASDPLNVLPANRWVLPTDWALLNGGPADPADGSDAIGIAEQFRSARDIFFAPNNVRGIALTSPDGRRSVALTRVAIGPNTALMFAVENTAGLAPGARVSTSPQCPAASTRGISVVGALVVLQSALPAMPALGSTIFVCTGGMPFEGPWSMIDITGLAASNGLVAGAALGNMKGAVPVTRDTALGDGDIDMWDLQLPPVPVSVKVRGTGFIRQVTKSDVYYTGTANTLPASGGGTQLYPDPYYLINIPESPFIPAVSFGGGYLWNSWGNDGPSAASCWASWLGPCGAGGNNGQGPYIPWRAINAANTTGNATAPGNSGRNSAGIGEALSTNELLELHDIRTAFNDKSISRDFFVMSDNHGEFMFAVNGDFKTDLSACSLNVLGGGRQCQPGDLVGIGTLTATADYPDFRGKHFPVASNDVRINWRWGGYTDVTVIADPNGNLGIRYLVLHWVDRDGYCRPTPGAGIVLLHPALSATDANRTIRPYDPVSSFDVAVDVGTATIEAQSGGGTITANKRFATDVRLFSTAANDPNAGGVLEFPLGPHAAPGATDECQAWVKVKGYGKVNLLGIAHADEGDIGWDMIVDFPVDQRPRDASAGEP